MTRPRAGVALAAVAATFAVTAAAQDPPRPPVFRAEAIAVSIDVAVTRGNRPVTGLTAADFAVTDNGVPQIVEQVLADGVPIDLTLIIDGSSRMAVILEDLRRNAQRILGLLRPEDRARVLVIETRPYELLPRQPVDRGLVLPEQPAPWMYAPMHDVILAGLVTRPDPDRRGLVVAITGGVDNLSITSVQALERVARRTETVLHVIMMPPPPRERPIDRFPDGTSVPVERRPSEPPPDIFEQQTLRWSSLVRSQQLSRQETALFETLPALTGGAFHGPGRWGRNVNAANRIRDVLAEFRQSYVIQYTPRDVAPGGWHDVVVRVQGVDPAGVRARAGYFGADQ